MEKTTTLFPQETVDPRIRAAVIDYMKRGLSGPQKQSFLFDDSAFFNLAKHLFCDKSKSEGTLRTYAKDIVLYCRWAAKKPVELIKECFDPDGFPDPKTVFRHGIKLNEHADLLKIQNLAPGTIYTRVAAIKSLYEANKIQLNYPFHVTTKVRHRDRAPRPEELQRLVDVACLRDKVIVTMMALGGFRFITLSGLRYYHVREDLERDVSPVHICVESELNKGDYCSYDTFIGDEAVHYLKLYLESRRNGTEYMKPEQITDESPLIRAHKRIKPLTPTAFHAIIRKLYNKIGIRGEKRGPRYRLRPYSLRKYFDTQLTAAGVQKDYVDYFMGHKTDRYDDVLSLGIEALRGVYVASGLSIKPKTKMNKIDALKTIMEAWGLDPNKVLTKKALLHPQEFSICTVDDEIEALGSALRDQIRKEMLTELQKSPELLKKRNSTI